MVRKLLIASLVSMIWWAGSPSAQCADPSEVRLKSGQVLHGRVSGRMTIQGMRLLQIQTDFGQLLVPQKEIEGDPPVVPVNETSETYVARTIKVVRIRGRVERRARDSSEWKVVSFTDEYGKRRRSDEVVFAGDTVRTGEDGALDMMLHRDAWIRLSAASEMELPVQGAPARASLTLLRGEAAQQIQGRPRGATFRVATPTAVLGVRGTVFAVASELDHWSCSTLEGEVEVEGLGRVRAGETGRWSIGGAISVEPLSVSRRRLLERPFAHYPPVDMCYVPSGSYKLGNRRSDDPVSIAAFWIDRCEVSHADVQAYVRATGALLAHELARDLPPRALAHRPAVYMSPLEAEGFARWVEKQLPTSPHWEAAARGLNFQEFPWGARPLPVGARVVRRPQVGADVDALGPVCGPTDDESPFGCLQMLSNAAELCRPGHDEKDGDFAVRGFSDAIADRSAMGQGQCSSAGFRCMRGIP